MQDGCLKTSQGRGWPGTIRLGGGAPGNALTWSLEEWIRVPSFLRSDDVFAEAFRLTQVEMAVLMELERVFKATYILEGDGNFVLVAYESLNK